MKNSNRLELYVNGKLQASSSVFDAKGFDISNSAPLKIGYGEMDYFSGKLRKCAFTTGLWLRKRLQDFQLSETTRIVSLKTNRWSTSIKESK